MLLILVVLLCCTSIIANDSDLIIQLPYGSIQGHVLKSFNNNDYYAFQEIPYAAPPIGKNRFMAPKDPVPWDGILNATKNEKICIQTGMNNSVFEQSEDCLFLNVYTPLNPSNLTENLPVFVWIHGGAFMIGSGTYNDFGPEFLIDYDIVIVAMNYRLGPIAFLSTDDEVIPGNLALKDQRKALRWVQSNIHLFGGDPNKVTLAGESAGAHSVSYQLLNHNSEELFRAIIQESGSAFVPSGYSKHARFYAYEVGRYLDDSFTTQNSSDDLLELIQNVAVEDFMIAAERVSPVELSTTGYVGDMWWTPVIENENVDDPFVAAPMHETFFTGKFHKVPQLIGFNSEESLMFINNNSAYLAEEYDKNVSTLITDRLNILPEDTAKAATELKAIYTQTSFTEDEAAFVRLSTDSGFTTGILRQAESSCNYVPVYLYQFSYAGDFGIKAYGGRGRPVVPGAGNVGHSEDLYYLWNIGFSSKIKDDNTDVLMRQRLLTLWTNFVKYLNPTPEKVDLFQNVLWMTVENSDLQFLNIDENLQMQSFPRYYRNVSEIFNKYIQPPYVVF